MSGLLLRLVVEGDGPFLYQLFCATRPDLAGFPEPLLQMQFRAQSLGYTAQYPGADHQLVLLNGRPVGRLLVDRSAERVHLVAVALLPQSQGRGIGSTLLHSLQAEATEAGVPLRLSVFVTNPARHLYERFGFTVTEHKDLYLAMQWLPGSGGTA